MTIKIKRCEFCKYFYASKEHEDHGGFRCRRFPPKSYVTFDSGAVDGISQEDSLFPMTKKKWWCGEFELFEGVDGTNI